MKLGERFWEKCPKVAYPKASGRPFLYVSPNISPGLQLWGLFLKEGGDSRPGEWLVFGESSTFVAG
jgi:hypothetical protein